MKIEEKELIKKAAIQFPDGEILTGKGHDEILERDECLDKIFSTQSLGKRSEGFVTNKGRFVSRQEADEIAFKAGQIKKQRGWLQSQDLNLE